MAQVRDRLITQEEAQQLVRRMIRKDTMNYIIRDELLDRGFSVHEANTLIREMRQTDADNTGSTNRISPEVMEIGLTIITIIIILMFLFLLISPVQ